MRKNEKLLEIINLRFSVMNKKKNRKWKQLT
jgi:hypothetical protein